MPDAYLTAATANTARVKVVVIDRAGTVTLRLGSASSADPAFAGPNAFVVVSNAFPIPPLRTDGPNSKWIAPRADAGAGSGNTAGSYTYRTTFDLTSFNAATAILTGSLGRTIAPLSS